MGKLSGEFCEPNRKDKVTRFRSVTYAKQLGLLVNTLGSHLKTSRKTKFLHSFSVGQNVCSTENECRNLVFLLVLTSRVELFVKKYNCRNLSLIING